MNDFLISLQKFYVPEESDEYWQAVIDEQNAFYEKYPSLLGRMLANLLINYLETKWRKKDNG